MNRPSTALILFAHGSRDPAWCARFELLAREVRVRHPSSVVRLAYMEFASPDLEAVVADLARAGARELRVLPLFLAAGAHVSRDVPEQIRRAAGRHPDLEIELLPPAGDDPRMLDLLVTMAGEALGAQGERP